MSESVIILAAGSSSRLGQSKQLIEIDGVPLLLKTTLTALDKNDAPVVVVLGAHADQHKKTIAHLPVEILTHTDWEKGMGSSLKKGLQYVLTSRPETNTVLILVCDQPLLTSTHLFALREAYQENSSHIVASRYGNILGVPALFDQTIFPLLLKMEDTQGARVVIERHASSVTAINWDPGLIDIDTPGDLNLIKPQSNK